MIQNHYILKLVKTGVSQCIQLLLSDTICIFTFQMINMNDLEKAIEEAIQTNGQTDKANKAYLEFIKANFIIPIEAFSENEPVVLYLTENNQTYLPVFSSMTYFDKWASDISDKIQLLKLSGVDLLKGIGDDVTVCLNIGSSIYKTFLPAEIARMRSMVLKFFS